MPLKDEEGVAFEIDHDQQNFRLLELPATLLSLITSRNPPMYCSSYFLPL